MDGRSGYVVWKTRHAAALYTATQENLGKAGSLKLDYGAIGQIKKRRRVLKKP